MPPSRRNITRLWPWSSPFRKERGKLSKRLSLWTVGPFYLTSTSPMLEILPQPLHCHVGRKQPNWTSARRRASPLDAFYSAEADGGPANRDSLTLQGCCSWKRCNKPYPKLNAQTNWDTMKVTIFPYGEENARTPPSPSRAWESVHSIESSRRNQSMTYNNEDWLYIFIAYLLLYSHIYPVINPANSLS